MLYTYFKNLFFIYETKICTNYYPAHGVHVCC